MSTLLALTVSVALAVPTDPLIAVATDQDVYVHDLHGSGHAVGPLGVGPTTDLATSPGHRYLYGTGDGPLFSPWRVYAGHSSVVLAPSGQRHTVAEHVVTSQVPGEAWANHEGVALCEWHPDPGRVGTSVIVHPQYTPPRAMALERSGARMWSIDGTDADAVYVASLTGGPADAVYTTDQWTLKDLQALPDRDGVLVLGTDHIETIVLHLDETGVQDSVVIPSGRGVAHELAVDPRGGAAWVVYKSMGLSRVDLSAGMSLADDLVVHWATDADVALDGTVWVAASTALFAYAPQTGVLTEHTPWWDGTVTDLQVLEARTRGVGVDIPGRRFSALAQALEAVDADLEPLIEWRDRLDWSVEVEDADLDAAKRWVDDRQEADEPIDLAAALAWIADGDPAGLVRLLDDLGFEDGGSSEL